MTRRKVSPYKRRIAISLPLQLKAEAKDLHMSPTTFYYWLKERAKYFTVYDQLNAEFDSQNNPEENTEAENAEAQNNEAKQDGTPNNTQVEPNNTDKERTGDLYTNYEGKEGE